ncbi:MAG: PEP-CTERM sorting domain-containing protein [Planctomycetota bacterium]
MKRYALTALLACGLYGASTANAAEIYFVDNTGQIRSFTGITDGLTPVDGNAFSAGTDLGTVASYGSYQGFTSTPDGSVYGVNGSGGVDSWSSIASWIAGDAATSESSGVYGAGSGVDGGLHGFSYDGNTGGFYAVVEGTSGQNNNPNRDGRLRQFATLSDFINNVNFTENTVVGYGGNILNFYYMDEDAPAFSATNGDAEAGSNYFQVAGNGSLEGWTILEGDGFGYFGGPDSPGGNGGGSNRSYENTVNFGGGVIGAFSVVIPEPTSLALLGMGGLCMMSRRRR